MSRQYYLLLSLVATVFVNITSCAVQALEYSTFIGNDGWDEALSVAVSGNGNVIVTGWTTDESFPLTSGAYDNTHNGTEDIFVAVFTPNLNSLISSTFVGGTEWEEPFSVRIDSSNNIIVSGYTQSDDFPTTPLAFDQTHNNSTGLFPEDGVIIKLSPLLDTLVASTYFGGNDVDKIFNMIIDHDDNVIVYGFTVSDDFPVTSGAFDIHRDSTALFISKLSNDLGTLIESTFLEGTGGYNQPEQIVEETNGNLLLTAYTNSADFPTTPGAYDEILNGEYDIIVFRITSDLSDLLQATYIGGSRDDYSAGLAIGTEGSVVVLGDSASPDFPTTLGSYDPIFNAHPVYSYHDLVVFNMTHDLGSLIASTFLGSNAGDERSSAIGLLGSGNILVAGSTSAGEFPTTPDAFDTGFNGFVDVVVSVLSSDLSELVYSTYLGGSGLDKPRNLVIDHSVGCYIAGYADYGFPTTEGAYDRENNFVDGFVVKFAFPEDVYPGIVTGPGPGEGNPPLVRTAVAEWPAYGVSTYGVNVACGDLDGDGFDEIITGPGPGAVFGPHVRGWTSQGNALPNVSFLAYGTNRFGVNVAAADIDGDGMDEILTGAGPGEVFGPHVRGWNVDGGTAVSIGGISYFAYGTNKYGVNVAGGDIDGDGYDEIVTGAGPGAVFGPHVRGWDYDGSGPIAPITAVSYLAYGTNQWGVNVACGDLDGDGYDEIITGPGPGVVFGAHVRGWNYDGSSLSPMPTVSFFAYPGARYGVVVSASDVDGDGIDEILTMPGPDPAQMAHARAWNVDGDQVSAIEEIDFYPYSDEWRYGGRIAGGRFE
jgi:hypothetical protein